ncbi:PQQ-binding-like beta-propeller repeat protein [Amycolatopsis taiwanensis]|uniref:outer membrane protein assembly factor BamB family protein n=1 Tax=Amycolatopsis taiwanensis TaxID=342230 RepID=UPI00146FA4E0|nr:PQQ-binding-like beta-propeller repeat protein [Amycolatopsis taiwanensis]
MTQPPPGHPPDWEPTQGRQTSGYWTPGESSGGAWTPYPQAAQQPGGYGMPGGYWMPPKRSKAPLVVTILVLVVVLAATGVTLAVTGVFSSGKSASSGGTGGSGPGEAKKLWSAAAINAKGDMHGGWVVDDHTVAYVVETGVTGYDLTTGKQLWQVPAPPGQVICEMSPKADGGIGAVGLGADRGHCDTAAAVDLTAAKLLWSEKLTLPENFHGWDRVLDTLSVAEGMVIVQDVENTFGYGARDGQRKWTAPPVPMEEFDGACTSMSALAEGAVTAQVLDCSLDGVKVGTYDTVSGAVKWVAPASTDRAPGSWWLLSVNPLIAADARTGMYYLSGPNAVRVPIGAAASNSHFSSTDFDYGSVAFDGTTMFTVDSDEGATPSMHRTMSVNSWDVTTGQSRWKHAFDLDGDAEMIGMSQGRVWVDYTPPHSDSKHQLVSFSPADGAMTEGPTFEAPEDYSTQPLTTQLVGNKIVRFGQPDAPVIVWDRGQ